jgi:hypothetical protein
MVMAESRALTLKLLADISDLTKNLDKGTNEVEGFGGKLADFGKKAGLAFAAAAAAAGAYAIKIGVDGVKAAIEDEQAQVKLAKALENSTGATQDQIKAVEANILKMSLSSGVADEQLRPALARLARSTGDVEISQKLLNQALDISIATGKPVETIANALGRAYDGNTVALGKLGIGLSAAELKTMSFTDVQGKLSELFGGAAAANADTFAGRLAILKVTFDEAKESVGAKLLPILQQLVTYVVDNIIPAIGRFAKIFEPVTQAIQDNKAELLAFGQFIVTYIVPVLSKVLGGAFTVIANIANGVIDTIGFVIRGLNTLIQGAVAGINGLIGAYNSIPFLPNIAKISAPSISVPTISAPAVNAPSVSVPTVPIPNISTPTITGTASGTTLPTSIAASMPSQSATSIAAGAAAFRAGERGDTIIITNNVSGAIDSEGTARAIVNVINESFDRGTGGAGRFQNAVT